MKLIDLDYDAGHVILPADNDDWFDHFEVEVEDNEYEYFLEKLKWWKENERREYHDKHVDADDEYFLLHYCPEIHKKIRAKLEEIAIEK